MTGTFGMAATVAHLTSGGRIDLLENSAATWSSHRDDFSSGHVVSVFAYDATWDFEERHPSGDELVLVLEGEVEVRLDTGSWQAEVSARAGHGCIIPAGAWHRLGIRQPRCLVFVTPSPGLTEHRPVQERRRSTVR